MLYDVEARDSVAICFASAASDSSEFALDV